MRDAERGEGEEAMMFDTSGSKGRRRRHACPLLAMLLVPLLAGAPARADYPDWAAFAEVGVIEVLTSDEDGDRRETKVWFVLVDGAPYLRTNGSRWLENLRRDPELELRIEDTVYQARVEEVEGDEVLEAVDRASREKYGWQEKIIHPFRTKRPELLLISPR
jgi:hypothetical protein